MERWKSAQTDSRPENFTREPLIFGTILCNQAKEGWFPSEAGLNLFLDTQESRWIVGWNGIDRRGNPTPVKPKVSAKKPSPIRGLVAGAVWVAAVIGCCFAFFSGSDAPSQEAKASSRPTSIKTAKATLPSANPNVAAKVKTVEGGTSTNAIARQKAATNSLSPDARGMRAQARRAAVTPNGV